MGKDNARGNKWGSWGDMLSALRDVHAGAPGQSLENAVTAVVPTLAEELVGRPRNSNELQQVTR